MEIQKVDAPQVGIFTNGDGIYSSALNILKSLGKVGGSIFLFAVLAIIFYTIGKPIYMLTSIFYIATIIVRIPDTWSDAVALESVGTLSILLLLIGGPALAVFYAITSIWLTRFVSPFGPIEEYSETLGMSIAIVIALLISPLLPQFIAKDFLMYMIYFQAARFAIYMLIVTIMAPAIVVTEIFYSVASLPLTIIQSYFILSIVGVPLLGSYGITGWALPSFQNLIAK